MYIKYFKHYYPKRLLDKTKFLCFSNGGAPIPANTSITLIIIWSPSFKVQGQLLMF